ncbi:hypothetical protein ABS772_12140 [Methylorubrum podarium]|uniref:Holin n=1 Tax=Methylorubrum podarium TaxID=200476 RepID=A0ABV1QMP8_9HYPH
MPDKIPPPPNPPAKADDYTASYPDFTGDKADNRILHITTRWLKYGTDDKGHAAAVVLSGLLLCSAALVAVIGATTQWSGQEAPWLNTLITWIGNAFLFTAGIAVGKGAAQSKKKDD